MCYLGIHTHHLRMVECRNQAQVMPGCGHINVCARLVGLGFQCKLETIAAVDVVLAQVIDSLTEALDCCIGLAACVCLCSVTSKPQDKDLCAELRTQVHSSQGFLQGIGTHFRIVGGKGSITKYGMKSQIDRSHGHMDAVVFAGLLEPPHNAVPLLWCGVNGHQVVIMQIHTPGANLTEHRHNVHGRNDRTYEVAERIATAVSDCPQTERELVLR